MAIEIKILDLSAAVSMFKELGLMETANALIAGDFEAASTSFINNMGAVLGSKGLHGVLRIIMKYSGIKLILNQLPGTSKEFNLMNIVKLKL